MLQAVPQSAPILSLAVDALVFDGVPVLGQIMLDVAPGETLALVGPSGIGKTSLLRMIAGLETGYLGRIDAPPRVSMIFQEPVLLPWRSARDNLMIAAQIDRERADAALQAVGLGARGDDFPGQLSLGQQRRLSLARAFAVRPQLLLMDEPFVSLDPDLVDAMMALFATLRAEGGVTTLFVTHVEAEAERLASRIVTLGGTPAVVTGDRRNRGAYFPIVASRA